MPAHRATTIKSQGVRNKRFSCDNCKYTTDRSVDLQRHSVRHMSVEQQKACSFFCPYPNCHYQAFQKSNLNTHLKIHTKVKDQICPDCDFETNDPASLTRHRKRLHDYQPRPRKNARGNAPYSPSASVKSPSRVSTSSQESVDPVSRIVTLPPLAPSPTPIGDLRSALLYQAPTRGSNGLALPSFQETFGLAAHHEVEGASQQVYSGVYPPYPTAKTRYHPYYHHRTDAYFREEVDYELDTADTAVDPLDVTPSFSSQAPPTDGGRGYYTSGHESVADTYSPGTSFPLTPYSASSSEAGSEYDSRSYPMYTYPPPLPPTFHDH
ncbi:hypothetical protein L218DRAFT_691761 [Marasmius fiardii PR-910]|nr:hypothetical protein L218DRAFT_691761 [Marasmius fiardii PR-910]